MQIQFFIPVNENSYHIKELSGLEIDKFFYSLSNYILYKFTSQYFNSPIHCLRVDKVIFCFISLVFSENKLVWNVDDNDLLFKYDHATKQLVGFQSSHNGGIEFNLYLNELESILGKEKIIVIK